MKKCIIGFKGKHNSSSALAYYLCDSPVLLTNSFRGLRNDIEKIDDTFDYILMFGIDRNLKDKVRIEAVAEIEDRRFFSNLDLDDLSKRLNAVGINNHISDSPTHFLCNEAYWHILRKFHGNAVFIHIPSMKSITDDFFEKIRLALD